ncbi:family 10 glycosylhydrolase [Zunongwangia sp. HRR-M8]|uniref:family 10 glycosylhydrolase n=1 Tax=Zunongwangia sp. HRR-M8 TaxID=3015170 RepID=UPI0022DE88DA|nr:family 10 glycosylhydrolase [Zunongwangia sp. HRR-M8]WBL22860.1 family 10 glycosylhydrolase [Zunongwangia sp. HRR-M8]
MKIKFLFLSFLVAFSSISCLDNMQSAQKNTSEEAKNESAESSDFKFWTWITADAKRTDSSYTAEFKKYKDNGLDAVLINTNTDPDLLSRLTPLAKKEGLEVHAWLMTMNRPGDSVALQHPDWYQVSRSGKSAFDDRPYVDYYQWLSPSNPEAVQHIYDLIEGLAKVEGVATVHLDYIRYPDVFLPVGLLPKYDLKQETELPDYDFDYSDASVNAFKEKFGRDPREMENPAIDIEWKQFRLNQVKNVVDHAYEIAHEHGKELSAAVFPYPEMADHMVRQRWDKWNIDYVLPMIYNNFYNEDLDWIGFATKQGVNDLKGQNTQLHTGIYIPEMTPEDITKSIQLAKENGAKGVSFFDGGAFTDEKLEAVKKASEN